MMPYLVGFIAMLLAVVWFAREQAVESLGGGVVTSHSIGLFYDVFAACAPGIIACHFVIEPPFETYMGILGTMLAAAGILWAALGNKEDKPSSGLAQGAMVQSEPLARYAVPLTLLAGTALSIWLAASGFDYYASGDFFLLFAYLAIGLIGAVAMIAVQRKYQPRVGRRTTGIVAFIIALLLAVGIRDSQNPWLGIEAASGLLALEAGVIMLIMPARRSTEVAPKPEIARQERPSDASIPMATHLVQPDSESKFCISCRAQLPIDARFCDNCGTSQE
jgi:ribosomal protein L40E